MALVTRCQRSRFISLARPVGLQTGQLQVPEYTRRRKRLGQQTSQLRKTTTFSQPERTNANLFVWHTRRGSCSVLQNDLHNAGWVDDVNNTSKLLSPLAVSHCLPDSNCIDYKVNRFVGERIFTCVRTYTYTYTSISSSDEVMLYNFTCKLMLNKGSCILYLLLCNK